MSGPLEDQPAAAETAIPAPDLFSSFDESSASVQPDKASFAYIVGLALVAAMMLLLMAVYPLLILSVGWLLWWHAVHSTAIFSERGWVLVQVAVYFGPLIVGVIFLFFFVKPLFARRASTGASYSLNHADAPLLFAFIGRICQLVNAPPPSRVDVNCEVNASAGFRAGLSSLWGHDVVLTIGLPLAAGLNMSEFGGVLAHEFAHFAQGAGMRLTYLIRSINFWFYRVVCERDAWDMGLENAAAQTDWRYPVIQSARACIWLTRRILWLLMQAGHGVSCFMLRQMEYGADRFQCKVAGWDVFESTISKLQSLNVASHMARSDLRESWKAKRLPDHLPAYILHKQASLTEEIIQGLNNANATHRTHWYDTHPSPPDRVQAARTAAEPGIFRLVAPASELFADFDSLSRITTRFYYERELGLPLNEQNLVDQQDAVREAAESQASDEAMVRYFGNTYSALRPLFILAHETETAVNSSARRTLVEARAQMLGLQGYARDLLEEYAKLDTQILTWSKAGYLMQGGFIFDASQFYLTECTYAAATRAKSQAAQRQKKLESELEAFETALRQRLCAALQLVPELVAGGHLPGVRPEEIRPLVQVLSRFGEFHRSLLEMRGKLEGIKGVLENAANHPSPERVERFLTSLSNDLSETSRTVSDRLRNISYPFAHARGTISLAEYVRSETPARGLYEGVFYECSNMLDRMFSLHYRVVSRLATIADEVERAVGVPE